MRQDRAVSKQALGVDVNSVGAPPSKSVSSFDGFEIATLLNKLIYVTYYKVKINLCNVFLTCACSWCFKEALSESLSASSISVSIDG